MVRRCGDRIQLSIALANFGYAAMAAGDYATAEPDLDEAVALAEKLQDGRLLPFHIVNRGQLRRSPRRRHRGRPRLRPDPANCVGSPESGCRSPRRSPDLQRSQLAEATWKLTARLSGAADAQRVFEAVGVASVRLRQQAIDPARVPGGEAAWGRAWTAAAADLQSGNRRGRRRRGATYPGRHGGHLGSGRRSMTSAPRPGSHPISEVLGDLVSREAERLSAKPPMMMC